MSTKLSDNNRVDVDGGGWLVVLCLAHAPPLVEKYRMVKK